MIPDVQPVTYLLAVAIYRQRFARERVDDHQRDEFFREVVRAVVVRTIGGQHRQAVGVMIGAYQMVAGGLAGGIRAVRFVAVRLAEGGFVLRERAIHFVGGNVQEAESSLFSIG